MSDLLHLLDLPAWQFSHSELDLQRKAAAVLIRDLEARICGHHSRPAPVPQSPEAIVLGNQAASLAALRFRCHLVAEREANRLAEVIRHEPFPLAKIRIGFARDRVRHVARIISLLGLENPAKEG